MLEIVKNWIAGFAGAQIMVDHLDSAAPGIGLFPMGYEQLQQTQDILGNVTFRYRCRFALKRVVPGYGSQEDAAAWALEFQNWVNGQKDYPQLGENTRWYAQKGRLDTVTKAGTSVYTVDLVGEFTRKINGGTE